MKILSLVSNTLRELTAKATMIVLAGLSTLIVLGALLVIGVEQSVLGATLKLFGQPVGPPVPADTLSTLLIPLQMGFAGGLFIGIILFGTFATAGIIPDALEKGTVDLYLSKPIRRWELLFGKHLGAVVAIFVNVLYFIGALWLVFGFKLGVWNHEFLLSVLVITLIFACLYSVVLLVGVLSRNTALSIIGAFIYLLMIGKILEGRESGLFMLSSNPIYRRIIDGFYYLLPQISAMQDNAMKLIAHQEVDWVPFVQSVLSASFLFSIGAYFFQKRDL